jgi:putative effector of murein hydrolase
MRSAFLFLALSLGCSASPLSLRIRKHKPAEPAIPLGGSRAIAPSMAPKAVTTPIAVAVSEQIGGIPALTATLAILGGILAAAVGQHMLHGLKVTDWRAHGLAAGLAGSAVAAAQVAARNELGAAFTALGIGLNGLQTAVLAPVIVRLWRRR